MATIARGRTGAGSETATTRGGRVRRMGTRGLWGVARIVSLITMVVVGIIVIAIALVLLEANRENAIVDFFRDAAGWLAGPFDNVFKLDTRKENIAVNFGLAAVVYAIVGGLIAKLLRR